MLNDFKIIEHDILTPQKVGSGNFIFSTQFLNSPSGRWSSVERLILIFVQCKTPGDRQRKDNHSPSVYPNHA
jgi:hypothetical protein